MERQVFPALVDAGTLYALASDDYWLDTGTPAKYLQANLDLIEGTAYVGAGAAVAPSARVEGSVISAGARVGAGAHVVASLVMPGAVVEEGAVVKRSIVSADKTVLNV
jgi:mannose-1-phosphate guanylyltransferase